VQRRRRRAGSEGELGSKGDGASQCDGEEESLEVALNHDAGLFMKCARFLRVAEMDASVASSFLQVVIHRFWRYR
jgi:hypothetical protein